MKLFEILELTDWNTLIYLRNNWSIITTRYVSEFAKRNELRKFLNKDIKYLRACDFNRLDIYIDYQIEK